LSCRRNYKLHKLQTRGKLTKLTSELPLPPLIYDLTFHFFPALLLTLDTTLLSPLISLVLSTAVAFLYWFWIEICYSYNGFYPYPIFGLLTKVQRVGLFAMSGAIMWVTGGGLRALYAWVNGYETVEELEKVKRAKNMAVRGKWE
jgi:hypothetical protein